MTRENVVTQDETEGRKRAKLIEEINGALATIKHAERRVADAKDALEKILNDARSQVGTAESELQKARAMYGTLRNRLDGLLPPVELEEAAE